MKKLLLAISFLFCIPLLGAAQDTLAGWTFKTGVSSEVYADCGNSNNRYIANLKATDIWGNNRYIEFKHGYYGMADFAAMATSWDNGDTVKFWQIVFNTSGYRDLHLSSKQISGENKTGPRYFILQYKIGSGVWEDVPGIDIITIENDWVSAAIDDLLLPPECDNSSQPVYIRWLMKTNFNIHGDSLVNAIGTSKIDEIFITGSYIIGMNDNEIKTRNSVLPNISSGLFNVIFSDEIKNITVINSLGMPVKEMPAGSSVLDLSGEAEGLYFVVFSDHHDKILTTLKIVVTR